MMIFLAGRVRDGMIQLGCEVTSELFISRKEYENLPFVIEVFVRFLLVKGICDGAHAGYH